MSALALQPFGREALFDPEVRKPCSRATGLFFCWTLGARHGKRAWDPNIELAKAVCRVCVLRTVCLEYALETNQPDGIWGGHTPWERRRIKRRRNAELRLVPA